MKKIFLGLFLIVFFVCFPVTQKAESSLVITAPDGYAFACLTNYQRIAPHVCYRAFGGSVETWFEDTTGCKTHTLTSIPSNVNFVLLDVEYALYSTATVNTKILEVNIYSAAACASGFDIRSVKFREFVATTVNTLIFNTTYQYLSPVVSGTIVTQLFFTNLGVNSFVNYTVAGYYD